VSDANLRQIRVLHLVSAGGVTSALQPSLFMPLLTRLPRQRVKAQVACLSPGAVPSAVLRQNGVPTFDLALSRKRFSPKAFQELLQSTRHFRPDVIQAWGHTAQVISTLLRKRCDWKPRLVWSVSDTSPLAKNPGFIDRQKLKYAARFSTRADRIVYTSESGAAQHRRVGFPEGGHENIPPGVDATRFKPDFAARRKLREELSLPGESFVVGMAAPFQAEYDHATLIRAVGELIKTNPNVALVLAGHGAQKGNAPLMALIGGGALSNRVHLLGEYSDINGLYNACDVVCSSSVNDQSRMNVVMAMLCGVPVVATGIGAQGELIGQHGAAIEPGSPAAFIKGITRIMQLAPEKRTQMAQGARKHALANYVYVRSLQKYLQLYYDLIGRQSLVTKDLPTPEIDASLTAPPALPTEAEMNAVKRKPITVVDLSDPDSLESRVAEREPDELPKWRLEQEQERAKREAELEAKVAASKSVGDVLEVFESQQVKALGSESPMTERARGVADDSEELLSPEVLAADAPPPPRASNGPSGAKKPATPSPAAAAAQPDAAKQAALKAARMAALQPIAPAAKKAASPVTRPPATSPITRPPVSTPITRPPAAAEHSTPAESLSLVAESVLPKLSSVKSEPKDAETDTAGTQPLETLPEGTMAGLAALKWPTSADVTSAIDKQKTTTFATTADPLATSPGAQIDLGSTQPLGTLAQDLANAALAGKDLAEVSRSDFSKADSSPTQSLELPSELLPQRHVLEAISPAAPPPPAAEAPIATGSMTEFGELTLLATGEWQAMQRSDTKSETKTDSAKLDATKPDAMRLDAAKAETSSARAETKPAKSFELSGVETLSLISQTATTAAEAAEPTIELGLLREPAGETKRAANGK
jgi:glycosyltransferase involved in cell wall biosynthesis